MAPFQRGAFFAPLTAEPTFPCLPSGRKKTMPVTVAWFFFHNQILFKGGPQIETEKQTADACPAGKKPKARFSPAKAAYYVFLSFMMFLMATQPVYILHISMLTGWSKSFFPLIIWVSTCPSNSVPLRSFLR